MDGTPDLIGGQKGLSPETGPRPEQIARLKNELSEEEKQSIERVLTKKAPLKLPALYLTEEADQKESDELETMRADIISRSILLLSHVSEVIAAQESNNTPATAQRMMLLRQILKGHGDLIADYEKRAAALMQKTVETLLATANLPKDQEDEMKLFLEGIPASPPKADDASVQKLAAMYAALKQTYESVKESLNDSLDWSDADRKEKSTGFSDAWKSYQKEFQTYEAEALKAGREQFRRDIGLPDSLSEADLDEFLSHLTRPLDTPDKAVGSYRGDKRVEELYAALTAQRQDFMERLPQLLRHTFPKSEKEAWKEKIMHFLVQRRMYEATLLGKNTASLDLSVLYAGVIVNEIAEEALEGVMRFSDRTLLSKFITRTPLLSSMTGVAQARMLKGLKDVSQMLTAKGVPMNQVGDFLTWAETSPMGAKFWRSLFELESPATVLIWGLYLYNSENKVKASMQFFSFIALSNAVGKVMPEIDAMFQGMGLISKIPGNPAVKFAVAMAVAFMAADEIDTFTTTIDKLIPNTPGKDAAGVVLSLVSGDALIGHALEGLESISGMPLMTPSDPDTDVLEFLSAQNVFVGFEKDGKRYGFSDYDSRGPGASSGLPGILDTTPVVDRMYHHTIDDWNARVDSALQSREAKGNPVLTELWKLQRIDNPMKWADRMSVHIFMSVAHIRTMEESLNAALKGKGIGALDGSVIATRDDGPERNDRELSYALDGQGALGSARKYCEALPEQDPVRIQWNEYVKELTDVAKNVSVYRHLGMYKTSQWLGDLSTITTAEKEGRLPKQVQNGMVEEIAYRMQRRKRLSNDFYKSTPKEEFNRNLVSAVKVEQKLPLIQDFWKTAMDGLGSAKAAYDSGGLLDVGGYDAGSQEYQERYALLLAVQEAARVLPKDKLGAALEPVRTLVEGRKVATPDDIRAVREKVTAAVLDSQLKGVLLDFPKDEYVELAVLGDAPLLFRGDLQRNVTIGKETFKPLLRALYNFLPREHDVKPSLCIFEVVRGSTGNETDLMRYTTFNCQNTDRSKWTVTESTAQSARTSRQDAWTGRFIDGQATNFNAGKPMPFEEWAKTHPDLASQLEPRFATLQESFRAKVDAIRNEDTLRTADYEKALAEKKEELRRNPRILSPFNANGELLISPQQIKDFTAKGKNIAGSMNLLSQYAVAQPGASVVSPDQFRAFMQRYKNDPEVQAFLSACFDRQMQAMSDAVQKEAERYASGIRDKLAAGRKFEADMQRGATEGGELVHIGNSLGIMRYKDSILASGIPRYDASKDQRLRGVHAPDKNAGHGFSVHAYATDKDFHNFDWSDNTQKWGWWTPSAESLKSMDPAMRDAMTTLLTTPMDARLDPRGEQALWRILNLFPYEVTGGWAWEQDGRVNQKHALHGQLRSLLGNGFVKDQQTFLRIVFDAVSASVAKHGSINEALRREIGGQLIATKNQWYQAPRATEGLREPEFIIRRDASLF